MKEITGNLWDYWEDGSNIAITTNGFVKNNGDAVMGRGCAAEAKERYPWLPQMLGDLISQGGNNLYCMTKGIEGEPEKDKTMFFFPVKHSWWEKADPELIRKSCKQIVAAANKMELKEVVIPRPGCGNGQLDWETDVKSICEEILDDRFSIITF